MTNQSDISINELHPKGQIDFDFMERWFHENYENPANQTPYIDGEYLYLNGGPFDALEELNNKFGRDASHHDIKDLVDNLESECYEWAPTFSNPKYQYDIPNFADNTIAEKIHTEFNNSISSIKKLLSIDVNASLKDKHRSLLYANVITSLESYLSDRIIEHIIEYDQSLKSFTENFEEFHKEQISIAKIYSTFENIQTTVKSKLQEVMWHNLSKAKQIYSKCIGIDIGDIKELMRSVKIRHDIVHRNGYKKDGEKHNITETEVNKLLSNTQNFVTEIELKFNQREKELDKQTAEAQDDF